MAPAASLTAHHSKAYHEHGPVLGGEFVPIPLARVGDEAPYLGVVFRAVSHQRELVGSVELDQAAGRRLLVRHLGPVEVVLTDPIDGRIHPIG